MVTALYGGAKHSERLSTGPRPKGPGGGRRNGFWLWASWYAERSIAQASPYTRCSEAALHLLHNVGGQPPWSPGAHSRQGDLRLQCHKVTMQASDSVLLRAMGFP